MMLNTNNTHTHTHNHNDNHTTTTTTTTTTTKTSTTTTTTATTTTTTTTANTSNENDTSSNTVKEVGAGPPAPQAGPLGPEGLRPAPPDTIRSISEISSCFFGPRPWHIEIRHRVKKHPQLICSDLRLSN